MAIVRRKVDVRFDNTASKPMLLNPAHIVRVSVEGGENFAVTENFEDMQSIMSCSGESREFPRI